MQPQTPQRLEFYERRVRELERDFGRLNARASFRNSLLVLLGAAATIIVFASLAHHRFPVWAVVLAVPAGIFLVERIGRYRQQSLRSLKLKEYYERGVARLRLDWDSLDDGAEFADPEHVFASDLNLFGRASLFQVLCSARTQAGRETLARWMKQPASRAETRARREAVAELLPRDDLRERIAAAGTLYFSDCRPETFRTWNEDIASQSPFPRWVLPVGLLLAAALLWPPIRYLTGGYSLYQMWAVWVALLSAEGAVAWTFRKRVKNILESIGPLSVEIPLVCDFLSLIEKEPFSSKALVDLAARLKIAGATASIEMRRLRKLVRLLQERENQWFTLLSYCLLWSTQLSAAIDRWHRGSGRKMLEWLAVLGEFEALVSLSTYAREHPEDALPELAEQGPLLDAQGLGHPLLDVSACVRNDMRLGEDVRFVIVSGSNMSGKSTFLRAIGLNVVLARMGAPVRCARLRLSELAVGASIGISDSLAEGRSHFFAEMDRLHRLIELAGGTPLLFLADEIMSGTNSHDRRIAAEWVIRALVRRQAIGLLTTHDLALTEIVSNGLSGENMHFEDTGEKGELCFDYKLHPGILSRSNALNIAHILGIDTMAADAPPSGTKPPRPPDKR